MFIEDLVRDGRAVLSLSPPCCTCAGSRFELIPVVGGGYDRRCLMCGRPERADLQELAARLRNYGGGSD